MSATRQDAWTEREDTLLAETVLSFIEKGHTQLKAFEEVGKSVNRTAAACGFRWNSAVRKAYKEQIESAKLQKKIPIKNAHLIAGEEGENNDATLIRSLDASMIFKQLKSIFEEVEICRQERKRLQQENLQLKSQLEVLKKDYNEFLSRIDQARIMVASQDQSQC